MRDGHRVVDTDSHVFPAVELLYDQGGPEFRGAWEFLKLHLRLREEVRPEAGDWERPWLELAPSRAEDLQADAEPGVLHDNPDGRLRWMDAAGVDIQLILPAGVTAASTRLPPGVYVWLLDAFNRYLTGYCDADPGRLKAVLQLPGAAPDWSVDELRRYSAERSVAAFSVCLPQDVAIDDPMLEPIWREAAAMELPLVHHAFPEATDDLARAAEHQWRAQRLVGALVASGVLDRHPGLRVVLGESGAGWLPAWLRRVGGLEHGRSGRILAALDPHEDEAIAESVVQLVGEDVLVWQSSFPGGGVDGSPADPLGWERLESAVKSKLLAGNAERCLRLL
jgi:predicted TIM-barrel fold metal-dependent hydrolase